MEVENEENLQLCSTSCNTEILVFSEIFILFSFKEFSFPCCETININSKKNCTSQATQTESKRFNSIQTQTDYYFDNLDNIVNNVTRQRFQMIPTGIATGFPNDSKSKDTKMVDRRQENRKKIRERTIITRSRSGSLKKNEKSYDREFSSGDEGSQTFFTKSEPIAHEPENLNQLETRTKKRKFEKVSVSEKEKKGKPPVDIKRLTDCEKTQKYERLGSLLPKLEKFLEKTEKVSLKEYLTIFFPTNKGIDVMEEILTDILPIV